MRSSRRWTRYWVPTVALVAVLASGAWLVNQQSNLNNTWGAQARAAQYAETLSADLEVGEVMKFSNHYYAELQDPDGSKATEVIVEPDNGAVQREFGPARMWNTRFGMMGGTISTAREVTATDAREAATEWLTGRDRGLTVDEAETFPGYYTLPTQEDGEIEGMLSVNAATGDVWYHSWHGQYQGMSEGS